VDRGGAGGGGPGWWAVGQIRTRSGGASLESQRPVALFGGNYSQATFSPDGSFVAFVGRRPVPQIWVKNLAEGDPIPSRPAASPRLGRPGHPETIRIVLRCADRVCGPCRRLAALPANHGSRIQSEVLGKR
jgi:hypothetical protein